MPRNSSPAAITISRPPVQPSTSAVVFLVFAEELPAVPCSTPMASTKKAA